MRMDWQKDWPEAIDTETGEDPDGVVHESWLFKSDRVEDDE